MQAVVVADAVGGEDAGPDELAEGLRMDAEERCCLSRGQHGDSRPYTVGIPFRPSAHLPRSRRMTLNKRTERQPGKHTSPPSALTCNGRRVLSAELALHSPP